MRQLSDLSLNQTMPSVLLARNPVMPRPMGKTFTLVGEIERSVNRPKVPITGRKSIAINGRWHALRGRTATFDQLLRLAFPDRQLVTPAAATMTFRHGVSSWPAGSLTPGDVIELTDGLLINANATYAS